MTSSPNHDQEIQISQEKLQKFGLILLGIAVLFSILGGFVTPVDDQGKPAVLMPEVKAVEDYRRTAQNWNMELSLLDEEIGRVLATDQQGDLFTQSRLAQQTLQHAVTLAQQVDQAKIPPIAIGLHEQVLSATMAYLEAARTALQWVSAPEQKNQDAAAKKLGDARKFKKELEGNQWLTTP